jgi:hypothetical protein
MYIIEVQKEQNGPFTPWCYLLEPGRVKVFDTADEAVHYLQGCLECYWGARLKRVG